MAKRTSAGSKAFSSLIIYGKMPSSWIHNVCPSFSNPALHDSQSLDRLPRVIGDFISDSVYQGELSTCHEITDLKACRFIDVKGGDEVKQGHSWVVSLASLRCCCRADGTRTVEKSGLFVILRVCINNRTRLIVLLHRMMPSAPPSR